MILVGIREEYLGRAFVLDHIEEHHFPDSDSSLEYLKANNFNIFLSGIVMNEDEALKLKKAIRKKID